MNMKNLFIKLKFTFMLIISVNWLIPLNAKCQSADLPQTNLGAYVHHPGYNQYDPQEQNARHGHYVAAPRQIQQIAQQSNQISFTPTPRPAGPDVSLEPIPADEPIPTADFPPMPDRADLPGAANSSQVIHQSYSGQSSQAVSNQQQNNQPGNDPSKASMHQHYAHVQAGAYAPPNVQQRMNQRQDSYNVNNGSNPVANPALPQYTGATTADLNKLGPEPGLQNTNPSMAAQAPTAVVINQSKTQDLSLPDDDYSAQGKPNYKAKKSKRSSLMYLMMPLQMGAGIGMGMGMSFMHY